MKKIITAFFTFAIFHLPSSIFGQANTYFHDRIDTTIFAVADTVGHGANNYYATNTSADFNVKQYENGFTVNLFFKKGNNGSATLTLITKTGTLLKKKIRKAGGQPLVSGDIPDSTGLILTFYNNNFRIIGILASSTSWLITGNSNIDSTTNFIGTTNAKPFILKTNGVQRAIYTSNGQAGYGMNPLPGFTSSQKGSSILTDSITSTPINHDGMYDHRVTNLFVDLAANDTISINGYHNHLILNGNHKYSGNINALNNELSITTHDSVGTINHPIASFNSSTKLYGTKTQSFYGFAGISEAHNGTHAENIIGNFGSIGVFDSSTVTNATSIFVAPPSGTGVITNVLGLAIQDHSGRGIG